MEWLLMNWKLVAIVILSAALGLMTKLYMSEVRDLAEFKGAIAVLGQEAEKEAKRINDLHAQTLKETNDEWKKQLPGIREGAIDNYMRRFPRGLLGNTCESNVPGSNQAPQGAVGAVGERMAPGETAFVKACAVDAGKLRLLREFATKNNLQYE